MENTLSEKYVLQLEAISLYSVLDIYLGRYTKIRA